MANQSAWGKSARGWRLTLSALLAVLVTACGGKVEEEDMPGIAKNPPWLMWGNRQTLKVPLVVGASNIQSSQLIKIAYGRPETWRFLFSALVVSVPYDPVTAHPIVQLTIDFNVQTGIGRDTEQLIFLPGTIPGSEQPGFLRFVIAGAPILPNARKWAMQTDGPVLSDTVVNPPLNPTELIIGQDIQINVRVQSSCSQKFNDPLILEIAGQLSPNVHLRPEWFKQHMVAEEDGGH